MSNWGHKHELLIYFPQALFLFSMKMWPSVAENPHLMGEICGPSREKKNCSLPSERRQDEAAVLRLYYA